MSRWSLLLLSLGFVCIASCNEAATGDDDDDAATTFPPGSVTYYEDVLPVVMENCQACHTEQGVGVPLDTYAVASTFASSMATRTAAREMPPWPPDPACGMPLKNERLLTEFDKALIGAWAADGAPEGNPANAPTPTPSPAATPAANLVLDPGADFVYDGTPDDLYMCFPVEPGVAMDFVKAQIYPGNARTVHHVILYNDRGGATGNLTPFECGSPAGADFLIGWAPGAAPLTFDLGIGMHVDADDRLLIQVHYHATGIEETDRTTVALWESPVPLVDVARVVWGGALFSQVPSSLAAAGTCSVPTGSDNTLLGMAPHMHVKGSAFNVTWERAGEDDTCLMDLPKWDFEWQGGYFYQTPLALTPGDKIHITCSWESGSSGTPFGEGTEDEMCFLFLYVIGPGLPQYCIAL